MKNIVISDKTKELFNQINILNDGDIEAVKIKKFYNLLCKDLKIKFIYQFILIDGCKVRYKSGSKKILKKIYGCYNFTDKKITVFTEHTNGALLTNFQFKDTILHEFLHHYESVELGLKFGRHTKYFYGRLRHLKREFTKC